MPLSVIVDVMNYRNLNCAQQAENDRKRIDRIEQVKIEQLFFCIILFPIQNSCVYINTLLLIFYFMYFSLFTFR